MQTDCQTQLTFWNIGRQQVTVDFGGGRIVSDAGLLAVRDFEKRLGIIAQLAARFPDPRSPRFITHSVEEILTQQVYQFLAGYFDCNDARTLRHDPLFLTLADRPPRPCRATNLHRTRSPAAPRWRAFSTQSRDAMPNCRPSSGRRCWNNAPHSSVASSSSMNSSWSCSSARGSNGRRSW